MVLRCNAVDRRYAIITNARRSTRGRIDQTQCSGTTPTGDTIRQAIQITIGPHRNIIKIS